MTPKAYPRSHPPSPGEAFRWELSRPGPLVFLFVFVVTFSNSKVGPSLIPSSSFEQWKNLTNQSFYGTQDFLFSYGPLYWLIGGAITPYNPYAYWLSIALLSTISGIFWAMLVSLLRKGAAYVLPAIAFFLFFGILNFPGVLYLWPFLIVACIDFRENDSRISPLILAGSGIAVGFFIYIRFLYGVVGATSIGSYLFYRMITQRNLREIIIFITSAIASYLLIGLIIFHDTTSITTYLVINKNLSFGNSVDMTLDVKNPGSTFWIIGLIFSTINIYLLVKRRSLLLTVNILLLLFFKLGFSRADHYITYFVVPTAVLSLVTLFEKNLLGRILYALIAAGLYYIAITPVFPGAPVKKSHLPAVDFSTNYQQRMQEIYNPAFALNKDISSLLGNSTIDFYPYNNEYAFANRLNYKHRPSFQGYMTLTPTLDRMNQKFFESNDRPDYVLWSSGIGCRTDACNIFDAFDQKYSLSEDPLTSTSILMNYHSLGTFRDGNGAPLILFKSNGQPAPYAERVLSSGTMKFHQWYLVPSISNGVVKLVPSLNLTLYGRIKNLLFRGNILKIKYKLASGDIREYRVNIINSQSGIWVSPNLDRFDLTGIPVRSIMLTPDSSMYFEPTFESKWVALDIKDVKSREVGFSQISDSLDNVTSEAGGYCSGNIDTINAISPSATNTELSGVTRVQGWLAESSQTGVLMDKTYVTLMDADGKRFFISTSVVSRPDVVSFFQHASLLNGGFSALIDLSGLNGSYRISLAGVKGSVLYTCKQFSIPVTINNAASLESSTVR